MAKRGKSSREKSSKSKTPKRNPARSDSRSNKKASFGFTRLAAAVALGVLAYATWNQMESRKTPTPGVAERAAINPKPESSTSTQNSVVEPSTAAPQPSSSEPALEQKPNPTPQTSSELSYGAPTEGDTPDSQNSSDQVVPAEPNQNTVQGETGLPLEPQPKNPQPKIVQKNLVDLINSPRNKMANPTRNQFVEVAGSAEKGVVMRRSIVGDVDKTVALTFDDGPAENFTEQVLAILEQYQIKATFFWIGRELASHQSIAQKVIAAGHVVGNHTWTHRTAFSTEEIAKNEIDPTEELIKKDFGITPVFFRPPGGHLKNGLSDYALREGLKVALWSSQSNDWTPGMTTGQIIENVLGSVTPGSIVLLHDGGGDRSKTVEALIPIIEALKADGYRFVTLEEMIPASEPIQ